MLSLPEKLTGIETFSPVIGCDKTKIDLKSWVISLGTVNDMVYSLD